MLSQVKNNGKGLVLHLTYNSKPNHNLFMNCFTRVFIYLAFILPVLVGCNEQSNDKPIKSKNNSFQIGFVKNKNQNFKKTRCQFSYYKDGILNYFYEIPIESNFDTLIYEIKIPHDDYYGEIVINSNNGYYSFIYSPYEDLKVWLNFNSNNKLTIPNSNENKAFFTITQHFESYLNTFNKLLEEKSALSSFNPSYITLTTVYEDRLADIAENLDKQIDEVKRDFQNTYAGSILAETIRFPHIKHTLFENMYDNYKAIGKDKFFYFIDKTNPLVLNNSIFEFKIRSYLNLFTKNNGSDEKKTIEHLLNSFKENTSISSAAHNMVIKYYVEEKDDKMVEFILSRDNIPESCLLGFSEEVNAKVNQIQNSLAGESVPNLVLMNQDGQEESLHEFIKQQDITIVYIWISWCTKCQTKTKELFELATKYNGDMGVFAISLDDNKDDWLMASQATSDYWRNLSELVPIESSSVAKVLSVRTTPTLFAINKQGLIIEKNILGSELEELIEQL